MPFSIAGTLESYTVAIWLEKAWMVRRAITRRHSGGSLSFGSCRRRPRSASSPRGPDALPADRARGSYRRGRACGARLAERRHVAALALDTLPAPFAVELKPAL